MNQLYPLWVTVQSAALLGDPAALTRQTASESTAPVQWYVQHIAGCLVGLAARVGRTAMADALGAFHELAADYLPPPVFAARVQVELIRLGMGGGAVQADRPPPG